MIEAVDICRHFGKTRALQRVTLRAVAGERIALVGRNGAGKTTLLRILATVLPPDSGSIAVDGIDAFSSPELVRAITGYVPEGAPADPDLTIREWLRFRGKLRRMPARRLRRRVREVAAFCRISALLGTPVSALSGGQRKTACLAEALLDEPQVLLLDDPAAGLDAEGMAQLSAMLASADASDGRVIVFSTHDEGFVRAVATRVVRLDRGTVVSDSAVT